MTVTPRIQKKVLTKFDGRLKQFEDDLCELNKLAEFKKK